jgi:hypothetical protein
MKKNSEYEADARECARLAALANEKASRDRLLRMACRYMESAAHERLALALDRQWIVRCAQRWTEGRVR